MAEFISSDFSPKEDASMDDKPMPDFAEAMGRIQLVTGCGTQQELALLLGIRQSSISDAKKRGSIPGEWLLTLWRKKGVNPDWILWGKGVQGLQTSKLPKLVKPEIMLVKEIRPPEDCSLEDLVAEIVRRVIKTNSL